MFILFSMLFSWIFLSTKLSKKIRKMITGNIVYRYVVGYRLLKTLRSTEINQACILSDPMNGCPGDFAEDFTKQNYKMECRIAEMNLPYWMYKKVGKWAEKEYYRQSECWPWNWTGEN
jgi:hypothetical protein